MSKQRYSWLTVPEAFRLNSACTIVARAEGGVHPYLVGSVLERADYHDVDLRLVLPDDEHAARFGSDPRDRRLLLFSNAVVSDWLGAATGLPIEFQYQTMTECQVYNGRPRIPQGMDVR